MSCPDGTGDRLRRRRCLGIAAGYWLPPHGRARRHATAPRPVRRILLPFTGQAISRRAFEAAVRLAKAENAVIMPAFLATVPHAPAARRPRFPSSARDGMPLLEAIEQRATAQGVPVDSRIGRGRSCRDALRKLLEQEHFDRIIVSADEDPAFRPGLRRPEMAARAGPGRDPDPPSCPRGHPRISAEAVGAHF